MRRTRRGAHSGHEFGGSGEDSFVAVVVTKLTGALLFILLLTMVIMALIPKAVDLAPKADPAGEPPLLLAITTPETLPEAIVGRPYVLALAATGGRGPLHWGLRGELPDGLVLDSATGRIAGVPKAGTSRPLALTVHVSDQESRAESPTQLIVYQSDRPLTVPSRWKPTLPPVPWRVWMDRGFGFLMLLLVHLVGMNALSRLERWSFGRSSSEPDSDRRSIRVRFAMYRASVCFASLAAAAGLMVWLWWPRT